METLLKQRVERPELLASSQLAFIGDAVYSLLAREQTLIAEKQSSRAMHQRSVELVRCEKQAACMAAAADMLTEEEAGVCRRARNGHFGHTPKGSTNADYRAATALEALFGYLYLKGEHDRLRELFELTFRV